MENIVYIYNAVGQKAVKIATVGTIVTTTNYLGGFQYQGVGTAVPALQFFPTAEGYVKNTAGVYSYVFNYTDHLGNVRLSYTKNADGSLKIIDESNYYPFGLKHSGYNPVSPATDYKYKFQGQERQDELGLNWDSFKWRNYDYAIGRFFGIDKLAEKYNYQSPYNFSENRVVDCRELEGLEGIQINVWMAILAAKVKESINSTLKSAVGNDGQPSLSGTTSNVNIAGYNVAKVNDIHQVSNAVGKKLVQATKNAVVKTGDALEKTGDTAVTIAPAFGVAAPAVAEGGEYLSKAGTLLKVSVDVANEDYDKALEKVGTEVVTGVVGNTIVNSTGADEVTVNAVVTGTKNALESKAEEKK